jgi:hypothetical protein
MGDAMGGLNRVRGDVRVVLRGEEQRLRLTFGALAEIESELGVSDVAELGARLRVLSPADLWVVVGALLRGAGASDVALVDHGQADLAAVASAVVAAFREASS